MHDDMNECPGRMHAIVGSTDTGKTNLVKLIVKHNVKSWHRIYAMCGTLNVQDDYENINVLNLMKNLSRIL